MSEQTDSVKRKAATSYDVARAAGVAQSTVSRCFSGDSLISPETRQRVLSAAAELGYTPNTLARSLITQRSNTVALAITGYTMRDSPNVMYTLADALAKQSMRVMLITAESDEDLRPAIVDLFGFPLDGLITCASMHADDSRQFLRRGVAMVAYNRKIDVPKVDAVLADHDGASRLMAKRLLQAGHKKMLCVAGPREAPVSRERIEGFISSAREAGAEVPHVLHTDFSYGDCKDKFLSYAAGVKSLPQAIFCANDELAFAIMDACRYDLRLRVPEDVSIVGFDDVAVAERPTYRLSTARPPADEMANKAVELLLRRIREPDARARTVRFDCDLIERDSARFGNH
ncbi:LacI family DNA-binding transcriptional regulator [Paraburkholderia nemoris]